MSGSNDSSAAQAETRRLVHDLRQPLAAMQMWLDLLGEAQAGGASEKEERYLGKIRSEVKRMTAMLAAAGGAPAPSPSIPSSAGGAHADAPAAAEEGHALAGLSMLVVEDDETTAEAIQLALEIEGATVAVAGTLTDGLELLRQRRPDAVLSDLRVADGDGFAIAAAVRRLDTETGRRTVAIAVTGLDSPETRAAARAAGFDETVTKPFAIARLVESIARLASRPH